MRNGSPNKQRGAGIEGVLMLVALCIVIFVFLIPARGLGPSKGVFNLGGSMSVPSVSYRDSGETSTLNKTSAFSNSITLWNGNGAYSIQPYEEYVSVQNNSRSNIDITGWSLTNSKGDRSYAVGGNLQKYTSDRAYIGKASLFVTPNGGSSLQDVVLKQGESVIITTGGVGVRSPYNITSFKENICSGYLENLPEYNFTPSLTTSCISPSNEYGSNNLDVPCQKYLDSMQSCHTPKFDTVDREGTVCNNCVDGNSSLSSSCVAFIRSHFNYTGCIANHKNDSGFSLRTWRIFLGQSFELWAESHETISLFDSSGKLVDYQSY